MIKIKVGYNSDQYYVIPDEEAHTAYYLFIYSDKKAVFSTGVAIRGQDIIGIEPAWNETMGWNPSHKLTDDDWNEIRDKGVDTKMYQRLEKAKSVVNYITPKDFATPLPELLKQLRLEA
jgi:hypothetical protein